MLALLGRAFGAFVVLYSLFWVAWLWLHIDALVFGVFCKDKKFKPTPPPCVYFHRCMISAHCVT